MSERMTVREYMVRTFAFWLYNLCEVNERLRKSVIKKLTKQNPDVVGMLSEHWVSGEPKMLSKKDQQLASAAMIKLIEDEYWDDCEFATSKATNEMVCTAFLAMPAEIFFGHCFDDGLWGDIESIKEFDVETLQQLNEAFEEDVRKNPDQRFDEYVCGLFYPKMISCVNRNDENLSAMRKDMMDLLRP